MTAAYMTRCVYLTFHGEYRGHGHPHESPRPITVPLVILAVLAVVAGWLNGFGLHAFAEWTAQRASFVAGHGHVTEASFSLPLAAHRRSAWRSSPAAVVGLLLRAATRSRPCTASPSAASWPRPGTEFLVNKYYLDTSTPTSSSAASSDPIAQGAYWFNQNVIDGVVNGVGHRRPARRPSSSTTSSTSGSSTAPSTAPASSAEGGGGVLRTLQTGRVQQYAAILFGRRRRSSALGLVLFT